MVRSANDPKRFASDTTLSVVFRSDTAVLTLRPTPSRAVPHESLPLGPITRERAKECLPTISTPIEKMTVSCLSFDGRSNMLFDGTPCYSHSGKITECHEGFLAPYAFLHRSEFEFETHSPGIDLCLRSHPYPSCHAQVPAQYVRIQKRDSLQAKYDNRGTISTGSTRRSANRIGRDDIRKVGIDYRTSRMRNPPSLLFDFLSTHFSSKVLSCAFPRHHESVESQIGLDSLLQSTAIQRSICRACMINIRTECPHHFAFALR